MSALSATRRHHRERIIAKRLHIVRTCWWRGTDTTYDEQSGRLDKYNLRCGCSACRSQPPRYRWTKAKTNAEVRREIDRTVDA